jgi:hypothetical protein
MFRRYVVMNIDRYVELRGAINYTRNYTKKGSAATIRILQNRELHAYAIYVYDEFAVALHICIAQIVLDCIIHVVIRAEAE